MELSPRLRAVADWVPDGARLADVGTDHGLLPVWLLLEGRISRAIAADLRPGPLDAARRTAARYGVEDKVAFRLCDGLTGIGPEEADTVVLAGMGGETIRSILSAAPWTRTRGTRLLLQPQSAFPELRGWLAAEGYVIRRERVAREGRRLYVILEAAAGEMPPLSAGELWAGRQSGDPLRGAWLDWLGGVLDRMCRGMERSAAVRPEELTGLEEALAQIKQMKKEWETWQ